MTRFRDAYGRALEWLVSALMIVLFVEVTAGVVFRAIGQSLIWYDEIASVLLAWLTFYGSALASFKRAHIGCPELVDAMPWRLRRALNIAAELVVIAFFVLLGWVGASVLPILATDALSRTTGGSGLFRGEGLAPGLTERTCSCPATR